MPDHSGTKNPKKVQFAKAALIDSNTKINVFLDNIFKGVLEARLTENFISIAVVRLI